MHDEAAWDKVPDLIWYMEYVIIMFFFVHGSHDLVQLTGYGWVVTVPSVEHCVCSCG